MRRIKDFFIQRDFLSIFTQPENLDVYIARWVPPRALCYLELFRTDAFLARMLSKNVRVTCLGAGPGSELVALMALMASQPQPQTNLSTSSTPSAAASPATSSPASARPHVQDVHLVDIGAFGGSVDTLVRGMRSRWGVEPTRLRARSPTPSLSPLILLRQHSFFSFDSFSSAPSYLACV